MLGFYHLKYQVGDLHPALADRFHRGSQADFRVVDRVRHKVNEQPELRHLKGRRVSDRGLTRPLVEDMLNVQLHGRIDERPCPEDLLGFWVSCPDQRFVGEHDSRVRMDDGMKQAEQPVLINGVPHPVMLRPLFEFQQRLRPHERGKRISRVVKVAGKERALDIGGYRIGQAV